MSTPTPDWVKMLRQGTPHERFVAVSRAKRLGLRTADEAEALFDAVQDHTRDPNHEEADGNPYGCPGVGYSGTVGQAAQKVVSQQGASSLSGLVAFAHRDDRPKRSLGRVAALAAAEAEPSLLAEAGAFDLGRLRAFIDAAVADRGGEPGADELLREAVAKLDDSQIGATIAALGQLPSSAPALVAICCRPSMISPPSGAPPSARDSAAYWLAERDDQLAAETLEALERAALAASAANRFARYVGKISARHGRAFVADPLLVAQRLGAIAEGESIPEELRAAMMRIMETPVHDTTVCEAFVSAACDGLNAAQRALALRALSRTSVPYALIRRLGASIRPRLASPADPVDVASIGALQKLAVYLEPELAELATRGEALEALIEPARALGRSGRKLGFALASRLDDPDTREVALAGLAALGDGAYYVGEQILEARPLLEPDSSAAAAVDEWLRVVYPKSRRPRR